MFILSPASLICTCCLLHMIFAFWLLDNANLFCCQIFQLLQSPLPHFILAVVLFKQTHDSCKTQWAQRSWHIFPIFIEFIHRLEERTVPVKNEGSLTYSQDSEEAGSLWPQCPLAVRTGWVLCSRCGHPRLFLELRGLHFTLHCWCEMRGRGFQLPTLEVRS